MSLQNIIKLKNQTLRNKALSDYIRKSDIGKLNDDDMKHFIKLYNKYYTEDKYKIITVDLVDNGRGNRDYNKHFIINKDIENEYIISISKLAGKKESDNNKLNRAFRNTINDQIIEYRNKNKLNPNDICPLIGCKLGYDAHIDHIIPFKELVDNYKKEKDIKYYYDNDIKNYILEEPFKTEWYDYHLLNAKLRYLSVKGNLTRKT